MKISVQESGGYAGLTQHYTLDTATLADKKTWEDWLAQIQFFEAPAVIPAESIGADMIRWQITVTDRHRQHTVTVTPDGTVDTKKWQELIDRIKAATTP